MFGIFSSQVPKRAYSQQQLSLKDALKIGIENYGTIKAKGNYVAASKAQVKQARLDYLPNLNLAIEVNYGTANGQNGPLYAFGPTGIATTGLPLAAQNWSADFGSLYLTNVNWDFFSFGRTREKIKTAGLKTELDDADLRQEIFQQQIRICAAYLNLLAAQRLTTSYHKNLDRADTLRQIIVRKAQKDLLAGVDSSQANAEVSSARSILLKAMTYEDEQNSALIKLLGTVFQKIDADTLFITQLPGSVPINADSVSAHHPILQYYKSRVLYSDQQLNYFKTLNYPTLSLGMAMQSRGSGFGNNFSSDRLSYTKGQTDGIGFDRSNYVVALGITWNLTQPVRIKQQIKSQKLISQGITDELELARQQLAAQLDFSNARIRNAIADYYETPKQVKAARDAYFQKLVLYNHGLTNLVDVTQALYSLVRAETARDIAYTNVWQALLFKSASVGDFNLFYDNL
ncbi:transporter [Niastella yeongjuensis]|uniref:Transporter n=1 Tax=Niastella yeongjuensis TaxID=354355 RepID=A0A1V9E4T0_9BACT|nr:transporter [Niastella yeongjuensis]